MNERVRREAALTAAKELLGIVAPALRPEEQRQAFGRFYEALIRSLEAYDIAQERLTQRLYGTRQET